MKHVLLSTLKTISFTVLKFSLYSCFSSSNTESHRLAQDETKSSSSSLSWPSFGLFLHLLFLPASLKSCDISRASIVMPVSQRKSLRSGSFAQGAGMRWNADLWRLVQSHLAPGPRGPPQVLRHPGGSELSPVASLTEPSLLCDGTILSLPREGQRQETH